ncbi:MAG: outer membrane beta-barrel protein [Bacteroidota bacterium]
MKHLFLLSFLLVVACKVQAQAGLKLGGLVMPQVSFLLNPDDSGQDPDLFQYEPLSGMAGGIVLGYNPGAIFGMRLNFIYSQQGGRYSVRNTFNDRYNFTTRLEYIKVPFMLGLHSNPENSKVMFSLYGGIQAELLTRAFLYDDDPSFAAPLPEEITGFPDAYARYSTWAYSAVGDVGFDVKLEDNFVLTLHLRGEYGVADAEDKDASYRVTEGGITREVNYWDAQRPNVRIQEMTRNLNVGLVIGVVYTFARKAKAAPATLSPGPGGPVRP